MTSSDATTVPPQDLPVIGSTPVLVQGNVEDSHIKTVPTTTLPSTTRELNRTDTATASTNGPPSDTANSTKTTLACVPAKFGEVDKNVTDEPASDARTHVLNAARTETDADATNQAPSQAESLTKRAKTCVGEELSWRNTNGPPSDTANSTKTTLACVPAKFGKVDKNVTDEPASDARTHILNASQTETDADAMNQAPSKAESVTKAGKTRVGGELSRRNTNGIHAICSDANKGRPKAGRTCEPPPATDKARGENATGTKKATKAGVGKTRTGGAGRKTGQKKSEGGGEGRAQKGRKGRTKTGSI